VTDLDKAPASAFWTFSLAVYGRPGVPQACLALQDAHGVDVNLLLLALWLGTRGRHVEEADLRRLDEQIAPWRADVVVPLRQVRRVLKVPTQAMDAALAGRLRDKVKSVELEAERLQQEALFALVAAVPPGREAKAGPSLLRTNVEAYARLLGATFPPGEIALLTAAAEHAL
jgi:uncharacterized protein (TIGR02444 family)